MPLLVCPACGAPLRFFPDGPDRDEGLLAHEPATCREWYPVIDGIPRLLMRPHRGRLVEQKREWFLRTPARVELAARWREGPERGLTGEIVRSFDDEWSRFTEVGGPDLGKIFEMYTDVLAPDAFRPTHVVLDAGCGAGRWAFEVMSRGPRVIALDLGLSVEATHRATRSSGRVACVQADVTALPLVPGAVDWAYSLGVIHHLEEPEPALAGVSRTVKPGGFVLLYLYYALEGRGAFFRALYSAVDRIRRLTSRFPRPVLRLFADSVAVLLYWPLARASRAVRGVGFARAAGSLPLAFYADRSLRVMRNDSLDRFGTRLERRYRRDQVHRLMSNAGLAELRVSANAPYWHAVGVKRG